MIKKHPLPLIRSSTQVSEGKNKVWTYYIKGETVQKIFMEENGKKTVNLNPKSTAITDECNLLYTDNLLQLKKQGFAFEQQHICQPIVKVAKHYGQ